MIVKVKECVHKNPPDTHQIQELIQRINATVDEDNVTFRNRWGSTFRYKGHRENIMDTLDHLPEELISPDVSSSPVYQSSPRGRSVEGVGEFRDGFSHEWRMAETVRMRGLLSELGRLGATP